MKVYPLASLFFLPFIVMTAFTVLNFFIGIIVDAMQSQHEDERRAAQADWDQQGAGDRAVILEEIRAPRRQVEALADPRGRR